MFCWLLFYPCWQQHASALCDSLRVASLVVPWRGLSCSLFISGLPAPCPLNPCIFCRAQEISAKSLPVMVFQALRPVIDAGACQAWVKVSVPLLAFVAAVLLLPVDVALATRGAAALPPRMLNPAIVSRFVCSAASWPSKNCR